ncbi:hypothetical protein RQP53_09535 [Paucibacter sp. APW11]|uniref:DUF3806 domain-containing protein n=1 Tax=Roseateles aquae TaxID=3077235 RepID=A0ABU3PAB0_9BURK|nr:hypothetical protein [Paucibacter sp. APW11]MDT8999507.1 hypothetical protein [Paucibacter sp. APW11]
MNHSTTGFGDEGAPPDLAVTEQDILANASRLALMALEQFNVDATYDAKGVLWLDRFLTGIRAMVNEDQRAVLLNAAGSFLGECVRQTYGGCWVLDAQTGAWGVKVNERMIVHPFAKAHKQLEGGEGDSVLGFFLTIRHLMNGLPSEESAHESKRAPAVRRWWQVWRRGR